VRYVLALSRSAFVIRHCEINLNDASMEHGVRIELASTARSARDSQGALTWRWYTATWWRKMRIER
jgi:hypothetical protein